MVQPNDASNTYNVMLGLDILIGLVLCFFGYLISQIRIAIGLILGAALGANIGFAVSQNAWVALAAGVAGGLLGAVLSSIFYFTGIFLIAVFLGGLLSGLISAAMSHEGPQPWVVFLTAIIFGSAAILLKQLRVFITIIATALGGAGWAIIALISFFAIKTGTSITWSSQTLSEHEKFLAYATLFGWAVLGAMGIVAQYKFLPPPKGSTTFNRSGAG